MVGGKPKGRSTVFVESSSHHKSKSQRNTPQRANKPEDKKVMKSIFEIKDPKILKQPVQEYLDKNLKSPEQKPKNIKSFTLFSDSKEEANGDDELLQEMLGLNSNQKMGPISSSRSNTNNKNEGLPTLNLKLEDVVSPQVTSRQPKSSRRSIGHQRINSAMDHQPKKLD
jgi:hypothetical protein